MLLVNKRSLFMARLNTLGANEASSDKMREMHSFEILNAVPTACRHVDAGSLEADDGGRLKGSWSP